MAVWLQRLTEGVRSGESLADTARRHGWNLDETYRWTQILRRAGQWRASTRRPATDKVKASTMANGRRAELTLGDEAQLPRILKLLEQTA